MRVTRDQRGYETKLLLHSPRPGERPRVLYWYRTAPGVRVGRTALDEEAIRTLEERYPEIEFDWPQLLEEAESVPPEVERRPERPRRRPRPEIEPVPESESVRAAAAGEVALPPPQLRPSQPEAAEQPARERNPLLDQLVGREIAARLRGRYAEVATRLRELPESASRDAWQQRADALDPDRWQTPEAILNGIQHADRLFDELKRELSN